MHFPVTISWLLTSTEETHITTSVFIPYNCTTVQMIIKSTQCRAPTQWRFH